MDIFYERQRGDLCRLHAINAYFGRSLISESQFYEYCKEYDSLIKGLVSKNMDGFSEGRSIISYILDKLDHKYLLLIPINSYKQAREHINKSRYNNFLDKKLIKGFFEFNKNHVWFNKLVKGNYYKIDSISGVNQINVNKLSNNGYLLIIENKLLYSEIEHYINCLKDIQKKNYIEIFLCNLHFSLKYIPLIKKNNNRNLNLTIDKFTYLRYLLNNYIQMRRKSLNNINLIKKIIQIL